MKNLLKTSVLLFIFCLTITGCALFGNKVETEFDVESLQKIEVFHYITSDNPEKKVVTSEDEMKEVLGAVTDLAVTSSATMEEIPEDTDTLIFRFILKDDSLCTIIYTNVEDNFGILTVSSEEHHNVKGKKILEIWENIDSAIEEIPSNDIPKLK